MSDSPQEIRLWLTLKLRAKGHSPDVGTIFGAHTVHETMDLVRAKQSEIDDITNHVKTLGAGPEWDRWKADWQTFLGGWSALVTSANHEKANADASFVSSWDLSISPVYEQVVSYLQPGGVGTSRLMDLYREYNALPSATPIQFRPVPQPTAPDADLGIYKDADTALKAPLEAARAVKFALPSIPTWAYVAGGIAAILLGVGALKGASVALKASTAGLF